MALSQAFLDEIRDRVSVSSVIGRKLRLEKRGREYISLCPFHNDSKPSLNIVDDKGFYHCFACGAHGDVIKFVMENDGLAFMEAVELLAGMAGLEVPKQTPEEAQRAERRRTLQDVVELACKWYERQLTSSAGDRAKRYLKERGLKDETIRRFRLGFAPDDKTALQRAMKAEGVDLDTLVELGLSRRYEDGGSSDWMRGRVLFPITDRRGNVIAFGGRVLGEGEPKYLNSPDTPLFHKGRVLYGLAQAREAAHKSGELVVAEGYMDVIALAQAGVPAVAPLGTALTEDQIAELWRLTPEPVVCFDGDTAGQRAARRAADRALTILKPGHSLRFTILPGGQDPDDIVKSGGAKAFRELTAEATPLSAFLWESEKDAAPADTPERRADFFKRIREKVREIADRTVQQTYADEVERLIGEMRRPGEAGAGFGGGPGDRDTYYTGFRRGYGRGRKDQRFGRPTPGWIAEDRMPGARDLKDPGAGLSRSTERTILLTLLNHPGAIDRFQDTIGMVEFEDTALDALRQLLVDAIFENPDMDQAWLMGHLRDLGQDDLIDGLLRSRLHKTHAFARPDASLTEACWGLAHLLRPFRLSEVERQITELMASAEAGTEAGFEKLQALRAEREQLSPAQDSDEDPWSAAGGP